MNFMNWTLQILLSFSIFAFLFLYRPCLLTSFNSLHLLFSTYISDFFSSYISRQFIFLLCNGILVFVITQGFGLIGRSASLKLADDLHDDFNMKNGDYQQPALDIMEMQVYVRDVEGMAESVGPVDKEEGGGEEEEEDGYDYNEMVTGESDERFEDFINEMKKNMRTEALQQD